MSRPAVPIRLVRFLLRSYPVTGGRRQEWSMVHVLSDQGDVCCTSANPPPKSWEIHPPSESLQATCGTCRRIVGLPKLA